MIADRELNADLRRDVLALVFILIGLVNLVWSLAHQELIIFSGGDGWDGLHYERLVRNFSHPEAARETVAFPYCVRVAVPFLVSLFGSDNISFYRFNMAVSILFSVTFVLSNMAFWKGSAPALVAAIVMSSLLYFSPVRFTSFYPAYVDPLFMTIMVLCVYFILRDNIVVGLLLCVVAIPVKEAAFYVIPLVIIFDCVGGRFFCRWKMYIIFCLLAVVCKCIIPISVGCHGQFQIVTGAYWFVRAISSPERFMSVVAALSLTLGPVLVVRGTKIIEGVDGRVKRLSVVSIPYIAFLSICGGSDVTRIFYGLCPFFAPLIIMSFRNMGGIDYACAMLGWVLTNRIFEGYQQPVVDEVGGHVAGFFSQFPDYAGASTVLQTIGLWAVSAGLSRWGRALWAAPDVEKA